MPLGARIVRVLTGATRGYQGGNAGEARCRALSQAMSQGIDGMAWAGGADDAEAGVLVSRRGGDVDLCSTMDGKSSSLLSLGPGSGGFAGVGVVGSGERGVVCTRKGSMSIFPLQSSSTAGPVSFTVGKSCRAMRVRSGVAATGGRAMGLGP